ncbi:hypothetical protein OSB04_015972 [Centaurea solstitialis]|uniref:Beta-glucosidase n=1 Tax=Centaurea solstitialis TaxID=347529 RepID=A0AA38W9D9_9ASTR|nr:hypothetical protein OSB04_015972 [Centaurea solstitialis]
MYELLTDDDRDQKAANGGLAFYIGWVSDPLIFADYPSEMRRYLGHQLPRFSNAERKFMANSIDYIATGIAILPVVPRGIGEMIGYLKKRYNNKPMFITENGYSEPEMQEVGVQDIKRDVKRIEFQKMYLSSLAEAIR